MFLTQVVVVASVAVAAYTVAYSDPNRLNFARRDFELQIFAVKSA